MGFFALGLGLMSPSVNFGDSGEFIAAAATLSIPHAPGYPLFCLIAHGWGILLPWASWAFRTNLLSVLCGAGALTVLFDSAATAGIPRLGALVGVLFLGFSSLWLDSMLATEVFALNNLLTAFAIWVACAFQQYPENPRALAALGLCLGLGVANHQSLVLAVPALLAEGVFRKAPKVSAFGLAWMVGMAVFGFAVYLYLPIRASHNPPLDWGHPADLKNFLHVLLRKDYGSFSLTVEGALGNRWSGLLLQSWRYFQATWDGLGPAALGLALLGFAGWFYRSQERTLSWRLPTFLALIAGPGFLWIGNPPFDAQTSAALDRFYLMSWIGVFFCIANGAGLLQRFSPKWAWLVLLPLLCLRMSSPVYSQRWDLAAYDYGRNILRSLPQGTRLFMDGGDDTFYTLAYLQHARRLREDVDPRDRGGLVFRSLYGPDFRSLSKAAKEERRQHVEAASARERPTFYSTLKRQILPGQRLLLSGLLRQVDENPGFVDWEHEREASGNGALWSIYPVRLSQDLARHQYRYRALVPVYWVMRSDMESLRGEWMRCLNRLQLAALVAKDVLWVPGTVAERIQWVGYRASRQENWKLAEQAYSQAVFLAPKEPDTWLNLGVSLEKLGRFSEAESAYLKALDFSKNSAQAYYNLGALYWSLKRWEQAAAMFEAALRRDPQDEKLKSFRDRALARIRR